MDNNNKEKFHENYIEGRNAVLEAFRSGKTIDKLFVLDGCQDGPIKSITREARKHDAIINYVAKERLDQMSETGKHQGVIASAAAYADRPERVACAVCGFTGQLSDNILSCGCVPLLVPGGARAESDCEADRAGAADAERIRCARICV